MTPTTNPAAVSYTPVDHDNGTFGQITIGGRTVELFLVYARDPIGEFDELVTDCDGNLIHQFDHRGATPEALHTLIEGLIEQGIQHRVECSEAR